MTTQFIDTPRDPHLPPPAVVDWLLEQDWSVMIPITNIQYEEARPFEMTKSKLYKYKMSEPVTSEDCSGRVFLPVEALDAFRKDRDARLADLERKRQACRADEMARKAEREQERIFKLDEKARACAHPGPWAFR